MADDAPKGSPYEVVFFVVGLLVVLGAIWWVRGGPNANQQTDTSQTTTQTQQ